MIFVNNSRLPETDKSQAMSLIWKDLEAIDAANSEYVKGVLPGDGWFRISRDGRETSHNAWLIIQHSHDRALQKQVLAAMEPLAKVGEVDGGDFALLYDRNEMFDGRPQRYGSQGSCKNGVMGFHDLEDAAKVDELRRAVGLVRPLADYGKLIGVGKPC